MVYDFGEPVDKALFTRFEQGRLTEVKELVSCGDIDADFVISGSAATWRGVLTDTIDPTVALTRRQLKVKGKVVTLLKNMNAFKWGSIPKIAIHRQPFPDEHKDLQRPAVKSAAAPLHFESYRR
jgi:hypothetical protein